MQSALTGQAQMQSINRGLQRAIGPADDGFSGMRMPQPKLADGVRLGDAMKGRFAIVGTREALAGIDMRPVMWPSSSFLRIIRKLPCFLGTWESQPLLSAPISIASERFTTMTAQMPPCLSQSWQTSLVKGFLSPL